MEKLTVQRNAIISFAHANPSYGALVLPYSILLILLCHLIPLRVISELRGRSSGPQSVPGVATSFSLYH